MAGQPGRSGGARPNSGPKPNAVKYKKQIASATDTMGRMLPEAAMATVDLATGAYILLVHNPRTGEWEKPRTQEVAEQSAAMGLIRVYREPPDIRAITVMFERLMGKVPQPVDITVRQAISEVMQAQERVLLIVEKYVPEDRLAALSDEIAGVSELHSSTRAAIDLS